MSEAPAPPDRAALRRRLLEARARFADGHGAGSQAGLRLGQHLEQVVMQLEPQCLGLFWPVRHEFNAAVSLATLAGRIGLRRALPFCTRTAARAGDGDDAGMHYRAWDGRAPALVDACGIAAADGPEVVPDVVLVPCLGYTASGYRLGYGAGFFDRWLARHAGVTAIGVAWSVGRLEPHEFSPQPHDQPLMAVVTEDGPVREGDASAARVAAA